MDIPSVISIKYFQAIIAYYLKTGLIIHFFRNKVNEYSRILGSGIVSY